jgi:Domain of unknown function (DUF4281)
MSADQVFSIANPFGALMWIVLAVFPRKRWVTDTLVGTVVPGLFAIAYAAIVVALFGGAEGDFSTLRGVQALFSNPWLLLAGWLHYLAFDLLIGRWEVLDAQQHGIPHWLVVPCLALTLFFGPAGWLLYRVVRAARST